MTQEQ
jgi:membrane-bound lytic murein transglycosylase